MKKYLKITLVLFSICLVCALATAGVNLFTAPKIAEYQEEQKMAAYMELFEGMSASNSEFINEGFTSSYVKEKVIVKDEAGNNLGYGMQVSGTNQYGAITLVVALDNEGNLKSIKCTENGQTKLATELTNWAQNDFTSGMSAEECQNVAVVSGATYGSNLIKNLIAAAFAEAGIMSPIQEKLVGIFGDSVDMGNTIEDTSFIYAQQITLGYEVKDGNNNVLGYYYEVNLRGQIYEVALNSDKTVKTSSNNTTIDNVVINEVNNKFDETLANTIMFGDNLTIEELEASVGGVDKYQTIKQNDNEIGKTVSVSGSNSFGAIKLYIGIKDDNTLAGIFIIENGQTGGRADSLSDYMNSFTSGMTGEEAVSENVYSGATFASNTTLDLIATAFEQVTGQRPVKTYNAYYKEAFGEDATFIELKDFKREEVVDGVAAVDDTNSVLGCAYVIRVENTYGYNVMCVILNSNGTFRDVLDIENNHSNVDSWTEQNPDVFKDGMTSSQISDIKYDAVADGSFTIESIRLSILIAMDEFNGRSTQSVTDEIYIKKFFDNAVYGRSVLVGTVSTTRIYDVYGSANYQDGVLIGHVYFIASEAEDTMINTVIAFDANNKYLGSYYIGSGISLVMYEEQIKTIFANADINTSILEESLLASDVEVAATIKDASSKDLGYFFIVSGSNSYGLISLAIGIDTEGKLVGISPILINQTNGRDQTVKDYLAKFTVGMTAEDVTKVDTVSGATLGTQVVKELLAKSFSLATSLTGVNTELTEYDDKISEVYAGYDTSKSKVIEEIVNPEYVQLAVEVRNSLNLLLGYAYVVYLTNIYGTSDGDLGYNRILVTLNEDNTFNKVVDLGNNHSDVDDWTSNNPDVFKPGMTASQIDKIQYDAVADASYTIETIKLAIKFAMQERVKNDNDQTLYDASARIVFPGLVLGRSEALADLPEGIDFGYRIVGATGPFDGNSTSELGYFFVVSGKHERGDLTLGIGIDTNNRLVGINIIKNGQTASWPQKIADYVASFTAGMTASDIANKDTVAGATFGTQLVKDLLAKAFEVASEYNKIYPLISSVFETFNATKSPYFTIDQIYNTKNVLAGLTLNEEIKDGDTTKTNLLGYAYIIYLTNIYGAGDGSLGYNKMLVILNANNTFNKIFDLENNHSDVDDWTSTNPNVFKPGMTAEEINNIKYDAVSGASYTIETIKLAIKIAMQEKNKNENDQTVYEAAAKVVFPGMVAGRSEILTNLSEDIDFGYRVVGATGPFDGNSTSNLGYFFVVSGEHKRGDLTLGIGIDNEGKLVGINIIENGQTASWPQKIADYVASFTAGMTASDVANKETVAGATLGTQLVKDLLAKAFNAYETLKGGNN